MVQEKTYITPLKPYKQGAFDEGSIKLSSNENMLGCSEKAREAFIVAATDLHLYPDGSCEELRVALAEQYKLDCDSLLIGSGSDEIIRLLFQAYLHEGEKVIYSKFGFLMYPISTQVNGGVKVAVPEKDFHVDLEAMLDQIDEQTKIIIFSNPNTPTGCYLTKEAIEVFLRKVPKDILVVLDGAYVEYMKDVEGFDAGHDLVCEYDNLAVLRTFSKAYGLAALRVGWMHASKQIIDTMHKIRGAVNVTMPSQMTAIAALQDQDFVREVVDYTTKVREKFIEDLKTLEIQVYPSQTNFVLVNFGTEEKTKEVNSLLLSHKIITRPMIFCGLSTCLRITIGLQEEMDQVIAVLKEGLSDV